MENWKIVIFLDNDGNYFQAKKFSLKRIFSKTENAIN